MAQEEAATEHVVVAEDEPEHPQEVHQAPVPAVVEEEEHEQVADEPVVVHAEQQAHEPPAAAEAPPHVQEHVVAEQTQVDAVPEPQVNTPQTQVDVPQTHVDVPQQDQPQQSQAPLPQHDQPEQSQAPPQQAQSQQDQPQQPQAPLPQHDQPEQPQAQPKQDQPQQTQPQQTEANQSTTPSSSSSQQHMPRVYITPDAERPIELAESGFGTKQPTTVMEVFKTTATKYTEEYALSVKRDGTWKHWNWGQYYNDSVQFARALIHLKFQPAQTVSILGFNSPEWFIADIGAIAAGGLAAGIYTTNGPEACAYIIGHSKSTVVVVENEAQLKKILQVKEKLPSVQAIVQWSGVVPADSPNLIYSWQAFLALGDNVNVAEVDARIAELKPGRACTLIYTSGTTGPPKAVMLSHDNLTYNAAASATAIKCDHHETVVSYLPLSHIAAQLVDLHGIMYVGGHVWFAQPDALKGSLGDTLKEVRPTLFFGVPRVWEKIQEKMIQVGKNNGAVKKKIAAWARGVGLRGGYP